jgi:alpha-1,2-mannosyltransferase
VDRPLPRALARAITVTTAINLALAGVWVVLWAALVLTKRTLGADFTAFYTGWRLVLDGRGAELYDRAAQAEMQRTIPGGQTFEAGLNPFVNPPHLVLAFTPLGLLPLETGFLVWTALGVALVAAIAWMLWRAPAASWTRAERLAVVGWLVGFPAMGIAFWQGAFSVLVAAGVAGTWYGLARGRDAGSGLALVVASMKPQAMGGPALAVLLARRWRAIVAAALAGAGLALAATVALGVSTWPDYLRLLSEHTASYDRYSDPTVMWNLRGTLALVLGREQAGLINAIAFGGFLVAMLVVAWLWRAGWRAARPAEMAARFGLTITLTLLFTPHVNPQDEVLAMVGATLAYAAWRGRRRAGWLAVAIGFAPLVVAFTNGVDVTAPTLLPVRVPTMLLIALAAVQAAALRRAPSSTNEAAPADQDPGIVPA